MKAVLVERSVPRFAAARAASLLTGSGSGISIGPLRLADLDDLPLPGPGWHHVSPRLAGICGSDLATIDGASSRYFESIVSFPFVLGHEIVGEFISGDLAGKRVVVEPVLGCAARGNVPMCPACASGQKGRCDRLNVGHIHPGLQTGFCCDTGGGWSDALVVHDSQLHAVPDAMSDEQAVLVEPTACAIHAALRGAVTAGERVVVLGSGTLGLLTIAALRKYTLPASILAIAKYPHQQQFATRFGADAVAKPSEITRAVRRVTGALAVTTDSGSIDRLAGGADVVFDCVGSSQSIAEALSVTKPGGRIILVGMPGSVRVDLAPLWQREIAIVGAYAYGTEQLPDGVRSTFALAFDLVQEAKLESLITAHYPLDHYEDAVRHAANAGRRGAVKVVFDLRRQRSHPSSEHSDTDRTASRKENR